MKKLIASATVAVALAATPAQAHHARHIDTWLDQTPCRVQSPTGPQLRWTVYAESFRSRPVQISVLLLLQERVDGRWDTVNRLSVNWSRVPSGVIRRRFVDYPPEFRLRIARHAHLSWGTSIAKEGM